MENPTDTTVIRVLFIAISYAPIDLPSDKQYLNDLISSFDASVDVAVWTLSETEPGHQLAQIGSRTVHVTSCCRLGHKPTSVEGETLLPHPRHNALRQSIEITSSLLYELWNSLQKAVNKYDPHIIHCYDNLGPITSLMKKRFPKVLVTCGKASAKITDIRLWSIYSRFLRLTYKSVDRVITYTDACRDILVRANIPTGKLLTLPWGIKVQQEPKTRANSGIRTRYNCAPDQLLIVVLPRGSVRDICTFIHQCHKLSSEIRAKFVFAIRPTRFSSVYTDLQSQNLIIEKGPSDFYDLLEEADIAWAPTARQNSTVLPPLAWLEAMGRGTPLITCYNPGVEECIIDGITGFIYSDLNTLRGIFENLQDKTNIAAMSLEAYNLVVEKFNVKISAQYYKKMWKQMLERSVE